MPGKLILLPNTLDDGSRAHLPLGFETALNSLDGLIAETPKIARRLLSGQKLKKALQEFPISTLSKHTTREEKEALLAPIEKGEVWGLVSDAGLPCIADPGSELVKRAREKEIVVEALSGPSSIFLALMLSGLNGQSFAFNGYLPQEERALMDKLKRMVQLSQQERMTQLFIETPFRNEKLFATLLAQLPPQAQLSVAADLTKESEFVMTLSVDKWKKRAMPPIHKRPCLFSFLI